MIFNYRFIKRVFWYLAACLCLASGYAEEASSARLPVPRVSRAVFAVESGRGNGTGFIMQEDGTAYFVSNVPVLAGRGDLSIQNIYGETVSVPEAGEVFLDRGLVRFPAVSYEMGLCVSENYKIGDPICALGHRTDKGTLTRRNGHIVEMSSDRLKISAEIMPDDGGGPVLDSNNRIVGVSINAHGHQNLPVQMSAIQWRSMAWADFCREAAYVQEVEDSVNAVTSVVDSLSDNPYRLIPIDTRHVRLRRWLEKHNEDARRAGGRLEKSVTEKHRVEYDVTLSMEKKLRANLDRLAELIDRFGQTALHTDKVSIPHFKDRLDRYSDILKSCREQLETVIEKAY